MSVELRDGLLWGVFMADDPAGEPMAAFLSPAEAAAWSAKLDMGADRCVMPMRYQAVVWNHVRDVPPDLLDAIARRLHFGDLEFFERVRAEFAESIPQ